MNEPAVTTFTGLVDLAAESLGGKILGVSDDFFAGAENLIKAGRGVFIEGKFTERGKWMDGWESRRKRTAGHDWCLIELGATAQIMGFDIDTHHFAGNHPSFASVEGLYAQKGTPIDQLALGMWIDMLEQSPLRPSSQNLFAAIARKPVSHLRLNIYPDGGVARFRAFGQVHPEWEPAELDEATRAHAPPDLFDLAALKNGGLALACSDDRFGPMNHLLLPGRADNMGGGWETRRMRAPGHDWILVKLGARGVAGAIEVDTNHFLGNYPDRCSIDSIDAPGARITDLIASSKWSPLLAETKLGPSARHFFRSELAHHRPASHVRLNIFPDGGVSRLRIWGRPDE